jgi:hypothetical protein
MAQHIGINPPGTAGRQLSRRFDAPRVDDPGMY